MSELSPALREKSQPNKIKWKRNTDAVPGELSEAGLKPYSGRVDTDTLSPVPNKTWENIADESEDPFDAVASMMLQQDVATALQKLKPRDRRIIELLYGLGFNEDGERLQSMSVDQVAKFFDVTGERIRQLEKKALRKLRHPDNSNHIEEYHREQRKKSELAIAEDKYKEDVDRVAERVLYHLNPNNVKDFLERLRRGSPKNGRLDSDILGEIFSEKEVEGLVSSEERYFRFKPPRTITGDILNALNRKLKFSYFQEGPVFSQWRLTPGIEMDFDE